MYIHSNTELPYTIEVFVLYLTTSNLCYLILPHFRGKYCIVFLIHFISLRDIASSYFTQNI